MALRGENELLLSYKRRFGQGNNALDRRSEVLDLLLVGAPILSLLFNALIGPLTVIIVFLTLIFFFIIRHERLGFFVRQSWPILILPLFCLVSVFWSVSVMSTVRYGVLYLATVMAAVLIGCGTRRLVALRAIQLAFSIHLMAALIFGRWAVWQDGSYVFAGLAGSKNAAADVAGVGLIVSITTLWWALTKQKIRWVLLSLITIPMAIYCLIFAKSTGAGLAAGLAVVCIFLWLLSRTFAPSVRTMIFVASSLVSLIILSTSSLWIDDIFSDLLNQAGKDGGLTGRVDLWRVADAYIARSPLLGVGYSAFWRPDNLDAVSLWRQLGIPIGNPFNFHNTPRSILVEIGLIGLFLFSTVWIFCTISLFWKTMKSPDYLSIFFCAVITFVVPRLYFEQLGFSNMHTSTLLIIGAFACGLRPAKIPVTRRI